MSLEDIVHYLHVIGAFGYFAGTMMSAYGLLALRRMKRVEEVRSIMDLIALSDPVSAISLLITIAAGIYMTVTTWGWQTGWIDVTLVSFVLLLPVGTVMGVRRRAIAKQVQLMPDGPLPESLKQSIYDPLLSAAVLILLALLLGITFLMVAKPLLDSSLTVIAAAVVLGLALSLLNWVYTKNLSM